MAHVRANGLDVHYTVEGAGPPIVLLHGATSSALEDWSAQRPLFRKAFRLYLVDARGHGGTKWDVRDGFDRDMLVDDLLAFVDALDLATFHVVGFSMGAMTALTFATRYPERLRTAMICGIDIVREPRSSVAKRLMDPGPHPARRARMGGTAGAAPRPRPGRRCVAEPAARDLVGRWLRPAC